MPFQPTTPIIRHKIKWHSAFYLIFAGVGVLSTVVLGLLALSSLATGLAIPPLLVAGLVAATVITTALLALRSRFVWIMDDRVFKGIQLSTSHVRILKSIRFTDVEEFSFHTAGERAGSVSGHEFSFYNKSGWLGSLKFQVKDSIDAATALEFFLLHIERSAWEPELEDWVYDWLREKGKHLPHIL